MGRSWAVELVGERRARGGCHSTPCCLVLRPMVYRVSGVQVRRCEMRVFVAGAAGAIGTRLVPQLVARGHQVTASTRSGDKVDRLRALGAEPVVVDGLDAAAAGEAVALAEPDAIVHQMTA